MTVRALRRADNFVEFLPPMPLNWTCAPAASR